MLKTLYDIPVNPKLLWDYSFSEDELRGEAFLRWYLARVLEQGNTKDLKGIHFTVIEKYLSTLNLSNRTRGFWERYFRDIRGRHV